MAIEIGTWLLSVVGPAALIGGIAGFFGRFIADLVLQERRAQHGRALEALRDRYQTTLEDLRSRIERTAVVQRAQFEVEFKAMQDVWATVASARAHMSGLRPMASTAPIGETEEQALKRFLERREQFTDARNHLVGTLDSVSPFLPPDVFAAANAVRQVVVVEALNVRLAEPKPFTNHWYERGEQALDKLGPAVEALAMAIRVRLASLVVIRDG